MNINNKNRTRLSKTLNRLDTIFDAKIGTNKSDEADILTIIIDEYKSKHFPILSPDPIEAIKIKMEEMNLKQINVANEIATKSRV